MGVYHDRRQGKYYVEFAMYGTRYKKRLAKTMTFDDATAFERQWRESVVETRIKNGEKVCLDAPESVIANSVMPEHSTNGYLYIVESGSNYKIGITRNYSKRVKGLRTGNPHGIRTVLLIRVACPELVERRLHHLFRARHVSGEWFKLNEEDFEFIRSMVGLKVLFNNC